MFLRCAKENNKKYDCKNNTYRISYSCIINNCAFCRFGIDQTAKTFRCKDEICTGYCTHKSGRNCCDPEVFLFTYQIHGCCPENDHCKCLVCPAKITPDNCIVNCANCITNTKNSANTKNRNTKFQSVSVSSQINMEPVRQSKSC